MRVIGYEIGNYRSLGSEKNYLKVSSSLTVLIGKNESGKSNVLEAIGELSFLDPINPSYMTRKNRGSQGSISVIADLEFHQSELEFFHISQERTRVVFTYPATIAFEGGLSALFNANRELLDTIREVCSMDQKRVWGPDSNRLKSVAEYLRGLDETSKRVFVDYRIKLENLRKWIVATVEDKEELTRKLTFIEENLNRYYTLMPRLYYRRTDQQLQSSYKLEEIKKALEDEDHILSRLFIASGIGKEEILDAFTQQVIGERQTIRNRIEAKIRDHIEHKFRSFYCQEKIELQIGFENGTFSLFVLTDDKAMELAERSNGLRWYLSLFIDILSRAYENSSVLYLLDEPGVHLHVNAQKELQQLLLHLCESKNQVIYATHSPYMIDSRRILNVRVIQKDETGTTRIFGNAYSQDISEKSKMDTLTPLLEAFGLDLKFNIGPSSNNNIITEGISDYMYLRAAMDYLGVEEAPNIIPAAGVSNINRIASILIGWGCNFKIILDYDIAGHNEYKTLLHRLDESLSRNIFFVNGATCPDETEMRCMPQTIESLVSKTDFEKLHTSRGDSIKTLVAREFYDRVVAREIILDEITVSHFRKLLDLLGVTYPH